MMIQQYPFLFLTLPLSRFTEDVMLWIGAFINTKTIDLAVFSAMSSDHYHDDWCLICVKRFLWVTIVLPGVGHDYILVTDTNDVKWVHVFYLVVA